MQGKTIAVLESRFGEHLAEMLAKQGAKPLRAPALAEEPDLDLAAIRKLIEDWVSSPVRLVIFQTGVGTRALFEATDALGLTDRFLSLLDACRVAVRGPKPTAVLRGRKVRIDLSAAEPFTTHEVLEVIRNVDLGGQRVLVQRYGETNTELDAALEERGAAVVEVPTYRWALPADTTPLVGLLQALSDGSVDCVVFTSASQVRNLLAVARREGFDDAALRANLSRTLVASIGPVCSEALESAGIAVGLEAHPPKLGPLVEALKAALTESS
jgi:uroporphyrinogen-III synthase